MESLLFVPLQKYDAEKGIAYGYACTEAIDFDGESMPIEVLKEAIPDYEKFGNIREMHQLSAVGVLQDSKIDDKGYWIAAKIVDAAAKQKCREGVYKGFSVGGKKKVDPLTKKITKAILTEISLVDRPNNPEALIELWKAAPSMAEKKAPVDKVEMKTLAKSFWKVADLSNMAQNLLYLVQNSQAEEEMEGDTESKVPEQLREAFKQLTTALKNMAAEEVAEGLKLLGVDPKDTLTKGKPMTPDEQKQFDDLKKTVSDLTELTKVGATHSKATKEQFSKIADSMDEAVKAMKGAKDLVCAIAVGDEKGAPENEVKKPASESDGLTKSVGAELLAKVAEMQKTIDSQAKELKDIKSNPASLLDVLKKAQDVGAVSKEVDSSSGEVGGDLLKAVNEAKAEPGDQAKLLKAFAALTSTESAKDVTMLKAMPSSAGQV